MGANHARVATELPDVELVAVADTSADAAREVARRARVPAYASVSELLRRERPELVAVAVPTSRHVAVATAALRAGAHVLVEKPIAADVRGGRALIRAARTARRVLAVGHIERANPAVQELARRLRRGEAGRVVKIHARRLSPFPERIQDAGALMDLGTHDLDVMRFLLGTEADRVWATARRSVHDRHEDLVTATILFPRGVVGLLEVDRITPTKLRELYVLGDRGMFAVNYLTQELTFYENSLVRGRWEALGNLKAGVGEGAIIRYPIEHIEPLRAEWESFVRAAQGRRATVVTGEDALRTLELAEAIRRSSRTGRTERVRH
jgi:predicted dehydrogenase